MKFLTGTALDKAAREIMREKTVSCAIAFWGIGAEKLISKGVKTSYVRIICNLRMGGTNPAVIRTLMKKRKNKRIEIRHNDYLHAKVFVGAGRALVGSANASSNGLGIEEDESSKWIEAAVEVEDVQEIKTWFEVQWSSPATKKVTAKDLRAAAQEWNRPSPNFLQFMQSKIRPRVFPTAWELAPDYRINKTQVAAVLNRPTYLPEMEQLVEDGIEVLGKDRDVLDYGDWILWRPTTFDSAKTCPNRSPFQWTRLGEFVPKGVKYPNEAWSDYRLALPMAKRSSFPFDATDKKFVAAFHTIIRQKKFKHFTVGNRTGAAWFHPIVKDLPGLWGALEQEYRKLA